MTAMRPFKRYRVDCATMCREVFSMVDFMHGKLSSMKRAIALLCTTMIVLVPNSILAQHGTAYIYEKIPNSEFYTFKTGPVEGMLEFSETLSPPLNQFLVDIFMKNNSRKTIDFTDAVFKATRTDGRIYYLSFEVVEVNTGAKNDLILKPGDIIIIHCRSPIRNMKVHEIDIELRDGRHVRFVPYERLGEFLESPEQHLKYLLSGLMEIFKFTVPRGR